MSGSVYPTLIMPVFACIKMLPQGKRIVFLECILDKGFVHCLLLLIKFKLIPLLVGVGFCGHAKR